MMCMFSNVENWVAANDEKNTLRYLQYDVVFRVSLCMSQRVLYFLHSTSVLSFYIRRSFDIFYSIWKA